MTTPNETADCKKCKCCSTVWHECDTCGGEGEAGSACIDDMCHGQDECLHGDSAMLRCQICGGAGGWQVCGGCCSEEEGPTPEDAIGEDEAAKREERRHAQPVVGCECRDCLTWRG